MTRAEEIAEYIKGCCYLNGNRETLAFARGAEWADDNPRNPWINVEDNNLPDFGKNVFVAYKDNSKVGNGCLCYGTAQRVDRTMKPYNNPRVAKMIDKHDFFGFQKKVIAWMPIPQLQRERK